MDFAPSLTVLGPANPASIAYFKPRPVPRSQRSTTTTIIEDEQDELLASIRLAFREHEKCNSIPTISYSSEGMSEIELAWTSDTVISTTGGVQTHKWTFSYERQSVQWACWGYMEQPGGVVEPIPSTGRESVFLNSAQYLPGGENATFGPYASAMHGRQKTVQKSGRVKAAFVFLTSIAKIFLDDGSSHTVHLPFLVRKAWPMNPNGVLVQRILSKEELQEEDIFPTLFTLPDPFAEFRVLAISNSDTMTDEQPSSCTPINPSDEILWASDSDIDEDTFFLTVNNRSSTFSIWRYDFVIPEEELAPPSEPQSQVETQTQLLSSIPTSTSNTQAQTLASLESQSQPPWHERTDSGARNELSATLDRMALGSQRPDPDKTNKSRSSTAPGYWAVKLYEGTVPSLDAKSTQKNRCAKLRYPSNQREGFPRRVLSEYWDRASLLAPKRHCDTDEHHSRNRHSGCSCHKVSNAHTGLDHPQAGE